MPVQYPTAVKAARMTAVRDAIDGGGGPGYIEIGTSGMAVVLATVPLSAVSGTVSGGVLTLDLPKSDPSAAGGANLAEVARIRNSAGVDIVTGLTVGITGADIDIDNTSIKAGQVVTVSSGTITHAT